MGNEDLLLSCIVMEKVNVTFPCIPGKGEMHPRPMSGSDRTTALQSHKPAQPSPVWLHTFWCPTSCTHMQFVSFHCISVLPNFHLFSSLPFPTCNYFQSTNTFLFKHVNKYLFMGVFASIMKLLKTTSIPKFHKTQLGGSYKEKHCIETNSWNKICFGTKHSYLTPLSFFTCFNEKFCTEYIRLSDLLRCQFQCASLFPSVSLFIHAAGTSQIPRLSL